MGPEGEPKPKKKTRGGRPRQGIVALSSAAVLAVYTAGYVRTQEAAHRFDEQDAARAGAVAMAPPSLGSSAGVTRGAPPAVTLPAATAAITVVPHPASKAAPKAAPAPAPASPSSAATPAGSGVQPQPAVSTPENSSSAPVVNSPDPISVESVATPTPVPRPAAPAPAQPAAATTAATTVAADATRPAAPQWKDGTYSGWGSCRHGDIQAQVKINAGKITSAKIIGCYTRYSCSWIKILPGQVVTRQSPNVDYITGATQSSDAFYYAIVEALSKAK